MSLAEVLESPSEVEPADVSDAPVPVEPPEVPGLVVPPLPASAAVAGLSLLLQATMPAATTPIVHEPRTRSGCHNQSFSVGGALVARLAIVSPKNPNAIEISGLT